MTPERGRRWLKAALAGTVTGYRLGAAHRYVGWDGTSRYRGHERHPVRDASRVEPWNTFSYLTPDFVRGEIF